jgi:hypothetical protein
MKQSDRARTKRCALIFPLFSQPLQFLALALNLRLVGIDLLLLLNLAIVLSLKLIANQRASAQSQKATDGGARAGMSHCRTDCASGCGTAKRADASSCFPFCNRTAGATDSRANQTNRHQQFYGMLHKTSLELVGFAG